MIFAFVYSCETCSAVLALEELEEHDRECSAKIETRRKTRRNGDPLKKAFDFLDDRQNRSRF